LKRTILSALLPLLILLGCAKAPVTGRTQLIVLGPQQEKALGFQAEQEIFKTEKITHDPRYTIPVKRVGMRLAKATGLNLDWKFYVIEKDVPNAFCLANGHVFVYTGLFKYIDDDAQLATVMGHEIGHAIAHHVAEKVSVNMLTGIATAVATAAVNEHVKSNEERMLYDAALGIGSQVGILLPYSRMQESEADHIGLILMAEACYDPREALKFWEKFAKLDQKGPQVPVYLRTHPLSRQRIENLKRWMPQALKIYDECHEKAKNSTISLKKVKAPKSEEALLGKPVK